MSIVEEGQRLKVYDLDKIGMETTKLDEFIRELLVVSIGGLEEDSEVETAEDIQPIHFASKSLYPGMLLSFQLTLGKLVPEPGDE